MRISYVERIYTMVVANVNPTINAEEVATPSTGMTPMTEALSPRDMATSSLGSEAFIL